MPGIELLGQLKNQFLIKTQNYKDKERRGITYKELRIVHYFTVGCLTFVRILLPSQSFNANLVNVQK